MGFYSLGSSPVTPGFFTGASFETLYKSYHIITNNNNNN